MKLTVVAVGRKMPNWINQGINEFSKRFPRDYAFSLTEVAASKRSKSKSIDQCRLEEAANIGNALADRSFLIAMDERGTQITTRDFSEKIRHVRDEAQNMSFIIGGAEGLDVSILNRADEILALSKMTLPHSMARLVLCEQLYRAIMILNHHPYHRD